MKHPLASSYALAFALTLTPAAGSFGQRSAQQGNSGQGQGQQGQGQPQQGQGQGQQQGNSGQGQGQQAQGQPQQGQGQGAQWPPNSDQRRLRIGRLTHDQPWQLAFSTWLDEASRNSGMTLAPADAALRAHLKLPKNEGLIVTALEPGSPAAAAGIRQNDVLVRLSDDPAGALKLSRPEDLEAGLKAAGDEPVSLVLLRGGHSLTLKVQPRVRVSLGPVHPQPPTYWIGVSVAPIEPALRSQLQIPDRQGLIAIDVEKEGPAARAGVRPFDIFTKFDGIDLADQAGLTKLVQSRGEKTVPLEVLREGKKQELKIAPERRKTAMVRWHVEPQRGQLDIVLPGAVLAGQGARNGELVETLDLLIANARQSDPNNQVLSAQGLTAGAKSTEQRLDELSAQIRELRQAIEAMAKAQGRK